MNPFEFSARTLDELERVQGRRGTGRRKVDRRGNRKAERALGTMLRAPYELVFGGAGRVSDAFSSRASSSASVRSVRAMQAIDRTTRRAPQVVVKITSRIHGAGSTVGAMTYAGRVGMSDREPIGVETSEGKHLVSAHDMLLLAREWQQWEQADEARRKGATAIAMVFSMPPGTDPERVRDAVRELAESDMANRRWVMALHTDEAHPHVHLIIAGRDNDGRRFNPDRAFLQHCRERFAENLRARGIEADATKRQARGYPSKSDPAPVAKMRERGAVPKADKGRSAMIAGQADSAQLAKRQQARARTADNIAAVRGVYQRAIAELEAHGGQEETERAKALRAFVRAMPDALDARAEIVERLKSGRVEPRALSDDAEKRADAFERLERAAARIRSTAAERNPGEDRQEASNSSATDRLRAKTADLKNEPGPNETRDAGDAARARLESMQRTVDKAVEDRERGKVRERERTRDKDRGERGR